MVSQRRLHFGHHIRHTHTETEIREHVPGWLQEEECLETHKKAHTASVSEIFQ